jgi:hypothetical protein
MRNEKLKFVFLEKELLLIVKRKFFSKKIKFMRIFFMENIKKEL